MNIFKLSRAYIVHRKLNTLLSVFLVAFGAFLIITLLLLTRQFNKTLEKNINNIDMVIGAKGSPMQIILSSIFHIDFPTGNISMEDAEYFAHHPLVKEAVPIALGDSYLGYRIVGTGKGFFQFYDLKVARGKLPGNALEVCIGMNIAKATGLEVGDVFSSSHGFSEGDDHDHTYKVTGVFASQGAVTDNLIVTPLSSYWQVHHSDQGEKSVTNLLIRNKSPMAAIRLPSMINATANLQAAVPSFEAARLFSMIGIGTRFIRGLAIIIIVFAALSIFISMYSALNEKKYDLAVMRALGASRAKLFLFSILEGAIISFLGGILGLGLSHLVIELSNTFYTTAESLMITGRFFYAEELLILGLCLGSGVIGSLIPAIIASKTEISGVLSEG